MSLSEHHQATAVAVKPVGELPILAARSLCEAFEYTARVMGDAPALHSFRGEAISWKQYAARVRATAAGLSRLGVKAEDTVALLLRNRVEFNIIDTATMHLRAVPFSLYPTSAPSQISQILANAGCRVLVTERALADRLRQVDLSEIDSLVLIDDASSADVDMAGLEALGDQEFDLEQHARAVRPQDVATLIYTSGTTGISKGVELTHHNILANWRAAAPVVGLRPAGRVISFLPAAHIHDRFSTHYHSLLSGSCVTSLTDPTELDAALPEVRPTAFASPPRMWEKMHAQLSARIREDADLAAVYRAETERLRAQAAGKRVEVTDQSCESVTAAIRAQLGLDHAHWLASGAAPIQPEVLDLFAAFGLPITEAYGLSENAGIVTSNPPGAIRAGTVGLPLPGVEVALAPDDEVLVRGETVMRGYRGEPQLTTAAIDSDGFLHTGDLGSIDDDGYLTLTGRKKELIISSSGKCMSPTGIENALKSAGPLTGQVCVIGDGRPYNVALLTLDPEAAAGLDPTTAATRKAVQEEVDRANQQLSRPEQIKRFHILGEEWQPGGDEMTPTMKIKRHEVLAKYAHLIDELYA